MLIQLTLIGKPGCHLCEDAESVLAGVLAEFESRYPSGVSVEVTRQNILEDAQLALMHSEEIPVLKIDGKMHSYWRIEPDRLLQALEGKLASSQSQESS